VQAFHRFITATVLALPLTALAATPITGTVINKTTNKPAAGDDVVLIRLAQGMQESTHATTDARGRFTLQVPDDGLHLVRVTHDKANYFKPAPAGTTSVDIEVYSSAPHVKGVTTEATVLRLQTDPTGSSVKVVENFFVKNESTPPMTQFSNQPFDFYLPEGAVVEGSAALAPNGMPVQAAPVPLAEKGHYTFLFPIRPGETRFQVSYHLPYSGSLTLDPHVTQATDTIAIMMPKAMTFTPAAGSPYSAVNDEVNAQTFVARSVTPGAPTSFQLSGKGELPRDTENPATSASGQTAAPTDGTVAATDNKAPGKGLDNPLDPNGTREPIGTKYKYWILAGLILLLAAGAGLMLRKPTAGTTTTPGAPRLDSETWVGAPNTSTLIALKNELFSLETDRLQNKISESDYQAQKSALETVLRRALSRSETNH
jgi:hypothetical protein